MLETHCNMCVKLQTIRNVLHSAYIYGRVARKKVHVDKPKSFWKLVIFSNKNKFKLFGSDGMKSINTEVKNMQFTAQPDECNVMVRGCFPYHGVGNLDFIDSILNVKGTLELTI